MKMRAFIYSIALIAAFTFSAFPVRAQEESNRHVASYYTGKPGTANYETLALWTQDGQRSELFYSYGKTFKEIKLTYAGALNGARGFKIQFPNGHTLNVVPKGLTLLVTDDAGTYSKVFRWLYEGPRNGRGTHCDPCAEDEREAMKIIKGSFLK
jgi:hypothetical protein